MVLCSASRIFVVFLIPVATRGVPVELKRDPENRPEYSSFLYQYGSQICRHATYTAVLCMLVCLQMCVARGICIACEKKSHVVLAP